MGKINSRDKGARFERETASFLRDHGYSGRRGQQYCGANGDADVVGLDGVHIECKRTERLNLYDALDQAKRDARNGDMPTVWHRKNNCETVVILRADDFMRLYKESELGQEST